MATLTRTPNPANLQSLTKKLLKRKRSKRRKTQKLRRRSQSKPKKMMVTLTTMMTIPNPRNLLKRANQHLNRQKKMEKLPKRKQKDKKVRTKKPKNKPKGLIKRQLRATRVAKLRLQRVDLPQLLANLPLTEKLRNLSRNK
tara:strand:- start:71 stop:493 length:423 start_codon:yes stop_codon:yes gene_type:complete